MASKNIGELQVMGGKGFEPLPAGPYPVEVTNATFVRKPGKNPYFKVEFSIAEGPYKNRKFWDNMTLAESESSAGVFFGKMRNLGLGEEFWAPWTTKEIDEAAPYVCQALIGKPAVVHVEIKDYQGNLSNNVTRVLKAGPASTPQIPVGGVVPTPTQVPVQGVPPNTTAPAVVGVPNLPPGL
jgi:hypothetical protein